MLVVIKHLIATTVSSSPCKPPNLYVIAVFCNLSQQHCEKSGFFPLKRNQLCTFPTLISHLLPSCPLLLSCGSNSDLKSNRLNIDSQLQPQLEGAGMLPPTRCCIRDCGSWAKSCPFPPKTHRRSMQITYVSASTRFLVSCPTLTAIWYCRHNSWAVAYMLPSPSLFHFCKTAQDTRGMKTLTLILLQRHQRSIKDTDWLTLFLPAANNNKILHFPLSHQCALWCWF